VAFKQPDDDPDVIALLASQLRRAHAHTDQATTFRSVAPVLAGRAFVRAGAWKPVGWGMFRA
jgi:hypothetical protein